MAGVENSASCGQSAVVPKSSPGCPQLVHDFTHRSPHGMTGCRGGLYTAYPQAVHRKLGVIPRVIHGLSTAWDVLDARGERRIGSGSEGTSRDEVSGFTVVAAALVRP